jgi:hypothetical protein
MTKYSAGELRFRLAFQRRVEGDTGDRTGAWITEFRRRAKRVILKGGEGVLAQRIQGDQPTLLVVRACSDTRLIDNSWRAIDEDSRQMFDLSTAAVTDDRTWIEILAVAKSGELFDGEI